MNKIYFEMSDGVIKVKGGKQRTVLGGEDCTFKAHLLVIFCIYEIIHYLGNIHGKQ